MFLFLSLSRMCIQRSAYAFDVLRGALCSAKHKSCAILYSALAQSMNNICLLFEAYQDHPALVNCILRLAGTAAEVLVRVQVLVFLADDATELTSYFVRDGQLVYLGDEEARHLFVFFIQLEEIYSKSESARIRKDTGASSSIQQQQAHEKYKAIKNLLELLNNVSSHDMPERRADVAKVGDCSLSLYIYIYICVCVCNRAGLVLWHWDRCSFWESRSPCHFSTRRLSSSPSSATCISTLSCSCSSRFQSRPWQCKTTSFSF